MQPVPRPWARRAAQFIAPDLLGLLATALLAGWSLAAVTSRCDGIALPLDDAYIHFTYARSFAALTPFVYSAGAAPSAGTTSLLWPLLLSPIEAMTRSPAALAWTATTLGFLSLWGLSRETRLLAAHFVPALARWVGLLPVAFAAHTWFAASGMEVLPFSWLLAITSRKILDWLAAAPAVTTRPALHWLLALATLCPLMRPEGAIMSAAVSITLAFKPRGTNRLLSLWAACSMLIPAAFLFLFTGRLTPTTAEAKWLPLNPYFASQTLSFMGENLHTFLCTLLDGRGWTPMFLPTGIAPIAWLSFIALLLQTLRQRFRYSVLVLLWLACGVVLASSYQTFLVNRLRYIWPFITPWFIGLGILVDTIRTRLSKWSPRVATFTAHGLLLGATLGLCSKLPETIADLVTSARAIENQQVSLAKWAKTALPGDAILGINDAGALGYFSGHRTFDLVGLTTAGEARHWLAGAGSRFEHFERLDRAQLPTHFIVYPEWLQADLLLGPLLAERHVEASILGGATMGAYVADYSALNSASEPTALGSWQQLDEVDVADLDSEAAHDYELFTTGPENDRIYQNDARADGGRSDRTEESFWMSFGPQCALLLRLHSEERVTLQLQLGSVSTTRASAASAPASTKTGLWLDVPGDSAWSESVVNLPAEQCEQRQRVILTANDGARFAALHYWSLSPSK